MWILKTDIAVGCHLVNLALEEVSLDVAVRGRMAAVIVFLHESFQFIGSRDAPVVPVEFLHLEMKSLESSISKSVSSSMPM